MDKLKNNKGFTIVELIMALSIFTLIMLPVFYGFATAAKINKLSNQQMKINAVVKQIKEYVPYYFKESKLVPQYKGSSTPVEVAKIWDGTNAQGLDNIAVDESNKAIGTYNSEYKYDLIGIGWDNYAGCDTAYLYNVILKKMDGTKVLSFQIYVNKWD